MKLSDFTKTCEFTILLLTKTELEYQGPYKSLLIKHGPETPRLSAYGPDTPLLINHGQDTEPEEYNTRLT